MGIAAAWHIIRHWTLLIKNSLFPLGQCYHHHRRYLPGPHTTIERPSWAVVMVVDSFSCCSDRSVQPETWATRPGNVQGNTRRLISKLITACSFVPYYYRPSHIFTTSTERQMNDDLHCRFIKTAPSHQRLLDDGAVQEFLSHIRTGNVTSQHDRSERVLSVAFPSAQ